MKKVRKEVNERKGEKGWIIGGDFNARTGKKEALEDGEEEIRRRSLDKTINKQKRIVKIGERRRMEEKD